jgi:hypothetical protein
MNRKYLKLLAIILFFAFIVNGCIDSDKGYQNGFQKFKIDNQILKLWSKSKVAIETSIKILDTHPTELYFIASDSYNILNYAFNKRNYSMIDDLLQLYMKTIPYIKKQQTYNIHNLYEKEEKSKIILKEPIYIWVNKSGDEELISSAQFLFVISFAFNKIASTPIYKQTDTMKIFINSFSHILSSHYRRWVIGVEEREKNLKIGSFSRRGWGCKDNNEEYIYARTLPKIIEELGAESYHGASYCNVIADPSLLIISGLGYYLGGYSQVESLYSIREREQLEIFFIKSVKVISKEFKIIQKNNFKNISVPTLHFQDGAWYGHPDYIYSGYIGSHFPSSIDKKNSVKTIGLDTAHGSRVIYLLEMLVSNQKKFNLKFPSQKEMKMFTDGFLYSVFNRDFKNPLFKNYMDGSNGWFRVNYSSRKGYGYAPFTIGSAGALLGGYPRLSKYNRELESIFISLFDKFNSNKIEDRDFINKFYEKPVWSGGEEIEVYHFYTKELDSKSSLFLINFYSSMI